MLKAEFKEREGDVIFLRGNVEIQNKDMKIFADRAEFNLETKDVFAQGNVVIQFSNEVLSFEEINLNLDSGLGTLRNGYGMIEPTIFYEAEQIEKKEEDVYQFKKAKITTCTQPVPRWRFSTSKANMKKDDYIKMWNAVFSIKKIPVLYFPYIRYPLDRERSTGFLMPQIGYTGQKGYTYTQSFFWAMKRNMDATFSADYYTEKGVGGGLEYRYMFSKETKGQLALYGFLFKDSDYVDSPNAYVLRMNHAQKLPLGFSLVADVDYSSSFDFLREFDNDFKRAVVSNRRSQVYLSKSWSYFNFSARASRFENYSRQDDVSVIRYSLPEIRFSSYKIKLFSPLYLSFTSSFHRWEHGRDDQYEEGTQRKSQSIAFNPQLTFPFTSFPWMSLTTSVFSDLDYFFDSYAPGTTTIVDEPLLIHKYGVDVELVGPVFYRLFLSKGDVPKLKHIIEPNISFRYESPVEDMDRIIDYRRYFRYHQIKYGLTNRILAKSKEGMPREIFTLGLNQTFYFSPEGSPMSIYLVDGEIPEFSDLNGYLRIYPVKNYSIDVSAAFNPYYNMFSRLRLGARLGRPGDSAFLRVNWFLSENPYRGERFLWRRHQIGFYGGVKIPRLSLELLADLDFNIKENQLIYTGLALAYDYQCLDFRVEIKTYFYRETPEVQFRFSVGLGNIGRTVDFLGGMGF